MANDLDEGAIKRFVIPLQGEDKAAPDLNLVCEYLNPSMHTVH